MIEITHPELLIVSAMENRPEIRDELVTLNENLFLDFKGLFTKFRDFLAGEVSNPKFTSEERAHWMNLQNYWPPPVADAMIADLKTQYINRKIKDSKPKTKKEMEELLEDLNEVDENKELTKPSEILEKILLGETPPFIKVGIDKIDGVTRGFAPGDLWIIGGYTGVGKTNIALRIVENVASTEKIFFYSLEMTQVDLVNRMLDSMVARKIPHGDAIDAINKMNMEIFTSKTSLSNIKTHLAVQKEKPKVVFVDFIQNVQTDDKSEYDRLTNVAMDFQRLALRYNITIVALSQVSNDSANSNKKTMGFKGSGAIASACDVGIELFRDKEAEGNIEEATIKCRISKNRHGIEPCFDFVFNKRTNVIDFEI